MSSVWWAELWRLVAAAAAGIVVGAVLGSAAWGLALGLVAFLAWHALQLYHLERWLASGGKRSRIPVVAGIWDTLVQYIYQLNKRSRERKKRLTAMLARFNASATALPDAVVILGAHGEIEWVNRAAAELLGIHPRDVGQRLLNLVRDPAFHAYYAKGDYADELELPSPERADVLLSVRIVPFGAHSRLLTARDMSEQARVRQMRRDFVANVSHELRTPLTVITGYLETFAQEEGLPAHLRERLATLSQQAERMNRLVEDLLTLSRLENTRLGDNQQRRIPAGAVLAGLVEEARKLGAATGHTLVLECAPGLDLRGRETEITSVFSNLITNAIQHTPNGSRVYIRWRGGEDGSACFEVEDNGAGVEARHVARLTERFYRVDAGRSRSRGGTGLGLSIVKHVAQRHNAQLHIDSAPGRGTRVSCRFPAEQVLATHRRAAS